MTIYPIMLKDKAKAYLQIDPAQSSPMLDLYVSNRGEGDRLATEFLYDLRRNLTSIKEKVEIEFTPQRRGGHFESLACEPVHRAFRHVNASILTDADFWRWVTIVNFSDFVEWRFQSGQQRAQLSNYGVHDPKENLMFRMWLRGDIGFEEHSDDPYDLARTGDQDLWRSHIIRQGYANSRQVARSLLRLQAGKLNHPRLSVEAIRELAKQVKRHRANVMLEVLTPEESDALVLQFARGL